MVTKRIKKRDGGYIEIGEALEKGCQPYRVNDTQEPGCVNQSENADLCYCDTDRCNANA